MLKNNTKIKHPRELLFVGIAIMSYPVIFWLIDLFSNDQFKPLGWNDIFFAGFGIGTVALTSGAVLWIAMKVGNYRFGVIFVRALFSLICIGWIIACSYLILSDLHIVTSIFLSVCLAFLLLGTWMFSWYPTITIKSEQVAAPDR